MNQWWVRPSAKDPVDSKDFRAIAYFRHSAQDRQENSVPLQREQVTKWATEHGITITKEFADCGKSGLSTEHRDAFNDMLENWVKKRDDFKYVLVLDVSRWGRFQDADLSAAYSQDCTRHGKQVIYTSIGIPKKDDPFYPVYLAFERHRAAHYSKELSEKVFKGCVKIAQQGFRPGGTPPYALSRMLLNEARKPVQILKPGERKSIQNQRVTLAPGDETARGVVRRIFQSFVDGADECAIALSLNRDHMPSPGGAQWTAGNVRHILRNEMYTGTIVYNKTTQRLLSASKPNPFDQWVRTHDAFEAVVSQEIYEKAQSVFAERIRIGTRENMLERLKAHYEEYGFIKDSLIAIDPKAPSVSSYLRAFGGVDLAFIAVFDDVLTRIRKTVIGQLSALGASIQEWDDFLVLNESLTVIIQPSVPIPYGCRTYWAFRADQRKEIDITLGVPLSNGGQFDILGYLALPRMIVRQDIVRLTGPSDAKVEMYGHHGLELIKELTQ